MANIWRRSPSARLTLSALVNKIPGGATARIADDFFEYVPPTNPIPTRIAVYSSPLSHGLDFPSGVLANDVLFVYAMRDGGPDSAPSSPWTPIFNLYEDVDGQVLTAAWFLCNGTESGTNKTFSIDHEYTYIVELWRNVDPINPVGLTPSTYVSVATGPGSSLTPVPTTLSSVTTTVTNSVLVAVFGVDVNDNSTTYTFSTPTDFGGSFVYQYDYNAHAVFNKLKVDTGASGAVTSNINAETRMGALFVINALASGTVNVRALIIVSDKLVEITDAQIGTGKKPLVLYNDKWVERSASEGEPLIIDGNKIRVKNASETLLI